VKKYDVNSKLFESTSYQSEAIGVATAVQFLIDEKFTRLTTADERPLPRFGIVRKKIMVKSGDQSISFDKTKLPPGFSSDKSYFVLFLEIDDVTEPKESLVNGNITKEEFISSLATVYVSTEQLKRIPIVDEVVFIDYQDDTDVESIIFKGLPEEKIIDPRTTSYENKNKQRTRNSFATGA
jgi:hypothetical protein